MSEHTAENDAPVEPLLVSGMRNRPSGEVRHLPLDGRGMTGTTTRGFLGELDEWRRECMAQVTWWHCTNPYRVTPPGSRCTCGAGDHRPPGAHNIHCVDPDASATRVIPPERSVDG
jgi:hypothetical protein